MPLVLAIEPEARQATILRRVVRERAHAEITVVDTKDAAIAAIDAHVPDLILVTALLSPRDEEELVAHLRTLDDADHLQTITIPLLASAGLAPDDEEGGFFRKAFRRKKTVTIANGCDPWTFAEQVGGYLRTAADVRATLAAERAYARAHGIPDLTNDLAELRHDSHQQAGIAAGASGEGTDATELPAAKPSMHDPEYAFSWRSSTEKGQGQGQGQGKSKGKGKGKGRKGSRTEEAKPAFAVQMPAAEPVTAKEVPEISVLVPEVAAAPPRNEPLPAEAAAPPIPLIKPAPEPAPVARTSAVIREIEPVVVPDPPAAINVDLPAVFEAPELVAEEDRPRSPACEVVPFPTPAPTTEPVLMDEAAIEELLRQTLGDEPLTIPEPTSFEEEIAGSPPAVEAPPLDPPAFVSTFEESERAFSLDPPVQPSWTPEPIALETSSASFDSPRPFGPSSPVESLEPVEPVAQVHADDEEAPVNTNAVFEPIEPFSFEPFESVASLETAQPAKSIEPTVLRPLRRLPPLAAWARVESVFVEASPATPTPVEPENDLTALLGSLRVPPQVLAVTYPRRPHIRWVRTAA